jgi:peroxiredoxin
MLDVHGAPTSLHAATAGLPAVIVFYRGGWCPYCNLALRTYGQELHPALTGRDSELIAVSP